MPSALRQPLAHAVKPAPGSDLEAGCERGQHARATLPLAVTQRQNRSKGGRPGMQQRCDMKIIKIQRMGSRPVDERRCNRSKPLAIKRR